MNYVVYMIKKSRLINLRIEDQLLEEIEKIAIVKFNENTSEAIRHLCNLGVKFELIPKNELDKEKIEEITNEMNQKIKDETIFAWIDSLEPEQQKAVKNWIDLKEE